MRFQAENKTKNYEIDAVDQWNKQDITWSFAILGTAIGAGVLFFPIRAGYGGLIPILVMLLIAYPVAFLCHRAFARLCLIGPKRSSDITETFEHYFGPTGGVIITLAYFFAIYPILLIYGVTMTNTFMAFWGIQLGLIPLDRGIVAFVVLLSLAVIILIGKNFVIRVMGYLVFPLIICLLVISFLLIPYWKSSIFETLNLSSVKLFGEDGILITIWLGVVLMVFSFSFAPIVSSFVTAQREIYCNTDNTTLVENKCSKIMSRACIMMIFVIMFFSFSCLFTLSPAELAEAKQQNIPILSYLANYVTTAGGPKTLAVFFEFAAPIIALIAVFKSFFGHYLGALEGLNGLIISFFYRGNRQISSKRKLNTISLLFIMVTTWIIAYIDPNILELIEAMGSPIIAFLLCLLPIYAIHKLPILARYRGQFSNYFVLTVGILTYLNIFYKLFSHSV